MIEKVSTTNIAPSIEEAIKIIAPIITKVGKGEQLKQISEKFEMLKSNPVCVLVCGEFKRGKSTFVNALIGRNLCATDTDICTSVVSVIKYSDTESVTRFYGDFSNPKSQQISLDELERYTVGSAEEIDNTLFVEIGLPLDILKKGLVIIDTPGVGGLDPRHASLTNFFIPKADIALFMVDVNEPMTTTELAFLKNRVHPYARQTALVVNKADLKDAASVEDIRLDAIAKVSSTLQVDKNSIEAIAVSSAAEAYPDSDLGESNFAALRGLVSRMVNSHRADLRAALKANLIELINLTITPLQAQLKQIEQPDVNQITQLDRQKKEYEQKLSELKDQGSPFRKAVSDEITIRREAIVNYINEANVTLQSDTFPRLLKSPQAKAKNGGEWLGRMLNDAIAEIGSDVTLQLESAFVKIAEMPQFEGMLKVDIRDYNSNIIIRNVDTSVPINKRLTPLMSGVGIFTAASFIIPGIGMLIGLGVGAYVAYSNQRDSANAYTESHLRQVYQPQLSGSINSLNTYVNTRFAEFQQEWLGVITERCKAYSASASQAIDNINLVKNQVGKAVNMRTQLQKAIKPLVAAIEMVKNS